MVKLRMAFHIGAGVGEVQVQRRGWGSFAQGAEANFGGCGRRWAEFWRRLRWAS
jgi:hypothetical protein